MRDEILGFLKRALDKGDVVIDLCDTGTSAGIVRSFEPSRLVESIEAVADEILDAAKSDSVGRSGKIRFELVGVYEGKRWGRQAVVIDAGGGNFGTDDANMPGIIVELIRDKREVMRMAVAHTDNVMGRMNAMLDLQAKQLQSIELQRIHLHEVTESLTQKKHEREVAMKQVEAESRSTARMLEEFVPMISAAGNKLLGKATGEAMPLGPEMVASFLGSFDESQIEKIASAMSPMQAAAFFQIMEATAEAKENAEKKRAAAANAAVNANGVGQG